MFLVGVVVAVSVLTVAIGLWRARWCCWWVGVSAQAAAKMMPSGWCWTVGRLLVMVFMGVCKCVVVFVVVFAGGVLVVVAVVWVHVVVLLVVVRFGFLLVFVCNRVCEVCGGEHGCCRVCVCCVYVVANWLCNGSTGIVVVVLSWRLWW